MSRPGVEANAAFGRALIFPWIAKALMICAIVGASTKSAANSMKLFSTL